MTSGEIGRFACTKCDGLFVQAVFHRMPDGKYCDACLRQWRARNMVEVSAHTTAERFRLLFGGRIDTRGPLP